jgi:hypothetical protein
LPGGEYLQQITTRLLLQVALPQPICVDFRRTTWV